MRVRWIIFFLVVAGAGWRGGDARASDDAAVVVPEAEFADRCGAWRSLAEPSAGVAVVARPAPPFTYPSPHFVVHYATESLESYARAVSESAELAYRVLVDTLLHFAPPGDGDAGGDERIDIYVRTPLEIGGVYGTTIPDTQIGTPYINSFSSWIEIADTLGVARRAIVTVHEVYHVVQLGYDRRESLSLLEMLSTWIEDRVYDDINLHYIYLTQFFRRPDRGLFEQTYTNVPWAIFLAERHGDAIIRETLLRSAQTPGPNPRGAFDGALQSMAGRTFVEEFIAFGTFNYFTSLRDDGAHYSEGAAYPAMRAQRRNDCYPLARLVTPRPMSELAANYFFFDGDEHRGRVRIRVEPEPMATSYLSVTEFRGGARASFVRRYDPGAAPDSFVVDAWEDCDSVLAVYQIDRGLPKNNMVAVAAYYLHDPVPDHPWMLVLDRDGCRNPFDGDGDEFTTRDGQEAAVSRALSAAGIAVVVSDSLPADLTQCRGVFVVGGFGDGGVTLSRADLTTLSGFMQGGGDLYLESTRLGAWVDSALAGGETELPAFWAEFGCRFEAGEDSANVAAWETTREYGGHRFVYDPGEPDHRVGRLIADDARVLARDERGEVRATVRRVGDSTRIVSTVLLGGSTGRFGSTRERYMAEVLALFDAAPVPAARPPSLRWVASFPNPARDLALLRIDASAPAPASVTVYDVAGRRVASHGARLVAGPNTIRIATPRTSGVFFVVVEAGGASVRGRFLVLR